MNSVAVLSALFLACSVRAASVPRVKSVAQSTGGGEPPWFCHDLDCPPYTTQETIEGDIEVRAYEKGAWVSTNISDVSYDEAMGKGFMRLFAYISGANVGEQKVKMTAPVRALLVPGEGPFCESHFTISFFVPLDLQDAPPTPTSSKVFIDPMPATRYYVFSYPGYTNESKVVQTARDVLERLEKLGRKFDSSHFFSAGYDSPFHLLNRHNEVWIPTV